MDSRELEIDLRVKTLHQKAKMSKPMFDYYKEAFPEIILKYEKDIDIGY